MGSSSSKTKGNRTYVAAAARVVPRASRLDVAISAITNFFLYNFTDDDGFAVATFSSRFRSAESRSAVGNGAAEAMQCLDSTLQLQHDGDGTRLFSSIVDAVNELRQIADHDGRPLVLIVLTDGEDNRSSTSAREAGRHIRARLTEHAGRPGYCFVVGIGDGIHPAALQKMEPRGNFQVSHIRDFDVLQLQLALIALELTTGARLTVSEIHTRDASLVWAQVQEQIYARSNPLDVMFLLDTSPSMSLAA